MWIKTGWALGFVAYVGVVVTWHAGFTAAAPFVVIPPVLVVMIGAGNLLSGRSTRRAPQFNRPDPVPLPARRGEPGPPAAPSPAPAAGGDGAGDAPTGGSGPGR